METEPVTTAVAGWTPVSITTLAISVIAIGISAVNLILNWRRHPRPVLAFEWAKRGRSYDGVPSILVILVNEGTASARGLRVSVLGSKVASGSPWAEKLDLEPGTSIRFTVPLMPVKKRHTAGGVSFQKLDPEQTKMERTRLRVRYAGRKRAVRARVPSLRDRIDD